MRVHEWSDTDINKMRSYFISGAQIKDIALMMNRTPTAVNKALTRFNIRAKQREKHLPINLSVKKEEDFFIKKPLFEIKSLQDEFDNWVSFWKLCEYLGEQKVCFFEITKGGLALEDRKFKVGEKILSAKQLMMMANKIRFENNLRPFFVRGLSW